MNTRNFRCFQTVYEERNLQTAAEKLFLSPQGLSKVIKSLEDECGSPLFVRTKEGFLPTESGKVFYEKSKVITKYLNDMLSSIQAVNERDRRFKIGFASGTIRAIDVNTVRRYMEENPEILASWHEQENESVFKRVLRNEISFGLVVGKHETSELKSVKLKSIDVVMYVFKGHRLWNETEIELEDLKNEPLILMNETHRIFHDVVNACMINGFNPNVVARVSEGQSLYQLVKNGIGIGISPKFFNDTEEIHAVKIKDAYTWDIYAIYRADSPDSALAESFIKRLTN